MNVRELIEFLSKQNPDALVVEDIPVTNGKYVELSARGDVVLCGVNEGSRYTVRTYTQNRGRIPCVVLTVDHEPRGL